MKKKSPIDQFKNLIKECVREVIQEELNVLKETKAPIVPRRNLQEDLKQKFNEPHPGLKTNGVEFTTPVTSTGDPMLDLLNETKMEMNSEDFQNVGNFGSGNAQNFGGNYNGFGGEVPVGDTGDMLSSAKPAHDVSQVSIDVVPDYSQIMKAMNK